MKSIHLFIISWPGQHLKALAIANSLQNVCENITIVYSDNDEQSVADGLWKKIRRKEPSFWSDKFQTAIHLCNSEIMVVIHADCTCSNWTLLLSKIHEAMQNPKISVYSPYVLGSPWSLKYTQLMDQDKTSLKNVALVDALVFALKKPIIMRMRELNYSSNTYGWGIDWFFTCASYALGYRVVMDTSIRVLHKVGTGYNQNQASTEMKTFLLQMNDLEKQKYYELSRFISKNKVF